MKIYSYKKKGKTFYGFNVYIGTDPKTGKRKKTNRRGFSTSKDAEIAYMRIRSGEDEKKFTGTLFEVYEEWLPIYRMSVKSSTVRKVKEQYSIHILPALGNLRIEKIMVRDVQHLITDLAEREYTTFPSIKNHLSMLFDFAIQQGYINSNPCDHIVLPRVTKKNIKSDEEFFYTRDELTNFLNLCQEDLSPSWYTFFRTIAYTGMRKGEALALRWNDIDFEKAQLTIRQTSTIGENGKIMINTTKTKSGDRIISIDKKTLWELKKHKMAAEINSDLVFPNGKGKPMALSTPIKYMDKVISAHSLKRITVHGLRHTHCSLLLQSGVPIKEVQRRLGHKDIKTTMDIYAHVTKQGQQKIADEFATYVEGSMATKMATN